ncbi:hypothetical protein [Mesorhizobium sp. CAU 1732]|uniref:hypothetical protein n=1 Tax=Mesorhizobium sp. CAU 1732 TaxID=3140358 RepID=UPI00326191CF
MNRHTAPVRFLLQALLILLWGGMGAGAPVSHAPSGLVSAAASQAETVSSRRHGPRNPERLSDREASRSAIVERRHADDLWNAAQSGGAGLLPATAGLPLPDTSDAAQSLRPRHVTSAQSAHHRARAPPFDA